MCNPLAAGDTRGGSDTVLEVTHSLCLLIDEEPSPRVLKAGTELKTQERLLASRMGDVSAD